MIGDNYQRISPFDRWIFDASGNLAGASASNRSDKEARFLTSAQVPALQAMAAGAGIGGTTITRSALIALADAGGMTPGAVYMTTDGTICDAITPTFLQPRGPWFTYGPRVVVGSATAETSLLAGIYTPPIGPSGVLRFRFSVEFDDGTQSRRMYLRQVGYSSSFPLFDRQLVTSPQWDCDIEVKVVNQGSSAVQLLRNPGNSSQGMGTTIARQFAMDLATSKEFAFSGLTSKTGTNVAISSLSKAGGVATGTVASGTFTGLHLARVAQISGAGDATFNGDPVQIAIVGSDPPTATQFTYTLSGSGSAGGSPQLQLYRYFAICGIQIFIDQGLTAG